MARGQAQKVDRILSETLERVRMQLIHIDQILTGAMEAVEEAGSRLRETIWGPVVKATALIRGIQAGLEFFRTARQGANPWSNLPATAGRRNVYLGLPGILLPGHLICDVRV